METVNITATADFGRKTYEAFQVDASPDDDGMTSIRLWRTGGNSADTYEMPPEDLRAIYDAIRDALFAQDIHAGSQS